MRYYLIIVLFLSQTAFADQASTFIIPSKTHVSTFTLPSGVQIKIVEKPFSKSLFKISSCGDYRPACRINGRAAFGAVDEIPKTFVSMISVLYQGHSYLLDSSGMYNAWGRRTFETKGGARYFGGWCYNANYCQFRGLFSDGGGSFAAEWQVVNGVSTRTVLTYSFDVVKLFMEYIDPPKYE